MNAVLVLPCLHQNQPPDGRIIIHYGYHSDMNINPSRTRENAQRCLPPTAVTHLTGDQVLLNEEILCVRDIRSATFVTVSEVTTLS